MAAAAGDGCDRRGQATRGDAAPTLVKKFETGTPVGRRDRSRGTEAGTQRWPGLEQKVKSVEKKVLDAGAGAAAAGAHKTQHSKLACAASERVRRTAEQGRDGKQESDCLSEESGTHAHTASR